MRPLRNTKVWPGLAQILTVFALAGALLFTASDALASHSSSLRDAINEYKSANYDRAIELLTSIVDDNHAQISYRQDALRYLGRCYVAKRLGAEAQDAIQELLTLEPPIVEFDPDRESPPMMKVYYQARKDQAQGSLQLEHQDPGIKTMAIIDFKNRSITDREKYDPLEKGFSDIMINRLNGTTDLRVVERDRLQWILDELEVQDKYGMEGAVRAGKQLGVHTVVLGSYILNGDKLWLSARLVKVESSEILLTSEVTGKVDKFFDLTDQLSKQISEAISSTIDMAAAENASDSNSLEAMLSYSEGLALIEHDQFEKAYKKFQTALDHDPSYERARAKAESIKPLLAHFAAR